MKCVGSNAAPQPSAAEKLLQALELADMGIAWKRAALEREHGAVGASEIDEMLRRWLCSDE